MLGRSITNSIQSPGWGLESLKEEILLTTVNDFLVDQNTFDLLDPDSKTENVKTSEPKNLEGDSNFKLENITLWKSSLLDFIKPDQFNQIMCNRVLVCHHLNNVLLEVRKKDTLTKSIPETSSFKLNALKPLGQDSTQLSVMVRLGILTLFPMFQLLQSCCKRVTELNKCTENILEQIEKILQAISNLTPMIENSHCN